MAVRVYTDTLTVLWREILFARIVNMPLPFHKPISIDLPKLTLYGSRIGQVV